METFQPPLKPKVKEETEKRRGFRYGAGEQGGETNM